MSLATVIEAVELSELSAWLVAVTLTVTGFGRSAGAVYKPAALILPVPDPLTLQLTDVFELPVTVAEN